MFTEVARLAPPDGSPYRCFYPQAKANGGLPGRLFARLRPSSALDDAGGRADERGHRFLRRQDDEVPASERRLPAPQGV